MKAITLPLESGSKITIFIGNSNIAVVDNIKNPKLCKVIDGLHNNGGWSVAMTRAACVKLIADALAG